MIVMGFALGSGGLVAVEKAVARGDHLTALGGAIALLQEELEPEERLRVRVALGHSLDGLDLDASAVTQLTAVALDDRLPEETFAEVVASIAAIDIRMDDFHEVGRVLHRPVGEDPLALASVAFVQCEGPRPRKAGRVDGWAGLIAREAKRLDRVLRRAPDDFVAAHGDWLRRQHGALDPTATRVSQPDCPDAD